MPVTTSLLCANYCHAESPPSQPIINSISTSKTSLKQITPIVTKKDLLSRLAASGEGSIFKNLSEEAKWRLYDTATTDANGAITSFMFVDIARELSPAEAYVVFASLGEPHLAIHHHNGQFLTEADHQSIKLAKAALKNSPFVGRDESYCNGGYCTANPHMVCQRRCSPPNQSVRPVAPANSG